MAWQDGQPVWCYSHHVPVNSRGLSGIVSALGQRLRRGPNAETMTGKCRSLLFTGNLASWRIEHVMLGIHPRIPTGWTPPHTTDIPTPQCCFNVGQHWNTEYVHCVCWAARHVTPRNLDLIYLGKDRGGGRLWREAPYSCRVLSRVVSNLWSVTVRQPRRKRYFSPTHTRDCRPCQNGSAKKISRGF